MATSPLAYSGIQKLWPSRTEPCKRCSTVSWTKSDCSGNYPAKLRLKPIGDQQQLLERTHVAPVGANLHVHFYRNVKLEGVTHSLADERRDFLHLLFRHLE